MEPISILLIDDHPTFLKTAARFLESQGGMRVETTVCGGRRALALATELRPDVIAVDISMPEQSGLDLIPLLKGELRDVAIVVLTMLDADSYGGEARSRGADAFVSKMTMSSDLVPAILSVIEAKRGGTPDQANCCLP